VLYCSCRHTFLPYVDILFISYVCTLYIACLCTFSYFVLPLDLEELKDNCIRQFQAKIDVSLCCEPPAKRTKTSAAAAANRVLAGTSTKKDEPFYDHDVYTLNLPYHNKIRDNVYDLAHQFSNTVKHILTWTKNHKKQDKVVFTNAMRTMETDVLNRFPELKYMENPPQGRRKYPTPPWVTSTARQKKIDSLANFKLKVPSDWPTVRSLFESLKHRKSSENLLMAGPVGFYFLRLTDMRDDYRDAFIELLRILQK
jgi:hypothetical protein